jgi:hypothetical protein
MAATTTDYEQIVRTVQLYVDGFNDGDPDRFREAFREDAWIFYTDAEGALHKNLISESFEDWASEGASIAGRVISVRQAGDVASVLLGFDNLDDDGSCWADLHALIRVDGVWKITNKTATHASRAGGAVDKGAEQAPPTAPDRDEIVRTVQLYVDGFNGGADKFEQAFDRDAWIFRTDAEGVLRQRLISESFQLWASWRRIIHGRTVSVTQAGDVAAVLLGFEDTTDESNRWADLHALIRVNGVWKITNKTATHSSRAGGVLDVDSP